jgi:hypothetical protein
VTANLSWLQYVCYGLWILVAYFVFQAKTEVSGLGRPIYRALACGSACLAMLSWNFQDIHAEMYSPRATATGKIIELYEGRNKGGSFYDEFRILDNGVASRVFNSGTLGEYNSPRPLQAGDTVVVSYRVWDDEEVIRVTKLNGPNAGWNHAEGRPTWIIGEWGIVVGIVGLVSLMIDYRRKQRGESLVYEDTSGPSAGPDIQTLGL